MIKTAIFAITLLLWPVALAAQSRFPLVTKFVEPPYPAVARAVRAEGDVHVLVEIGSNGSVVNATAISGHKFLSKAAEIAAKSWAFTQVPGTHYVILVFKFRDSDRNKWKPATLMGEFTLGFIEPRYKVVQTIDYQTTGIE